MNIMSNTVMPYGCLVDGTRTRLFQHAIEQTVKPGDVVLEGGTGTGILSFFAAKAGAKNVVAVEIDPVVAGYLRENAQENGLGSIIEVLEQDVCSLSLPGPVDVFVCEMIETAMMEEMQVLALNALRERGIITPATRLIPYRYRTFIEIGYAPFDYYGFKIRFPIHDWASESGREFQNTFRAYSSRRLVADVDLTRAVDRRVNKTITFKAPVTGTINAVALSGFAYLIEGVVVGETSSLNGRKIMPINEVQVRRGQTLQLQVSYEMGGGLGTFVARCE